MWSVNLVLVTLALMQICSIIVFMSGYFPSKQHLTGNASENHTDSLSMVDGKRLRPLYNRMVMVLIDALRADYVYGNTSSHMPYLTKRMNSKNTLTYLSSAHPPTVTLPRLKAMTSGSIPGFLDVIWNFDSQELSMDNIISQMKNVGRNIIFYGDDTWLKLFPNHFLRSEGTTSFIVTDYTEVDNNVTRHIDDEMKARDWDIMILHYLGLDHIGHTSGPRSSLIGPKLREMDSIIEKILESLEASNDTGTLFLLCGDHGMSDQGSHGGSSPSETVTPLVLVGKTLENKLEKPEIYQIDMVPTLSILLGTPVPLNNLGVLMNNVLNGYSPKEMLTAVYKNARQIANLYNLNYAVDDEAMDIFNRAVNAHKQWLDDGAESDHYNKIIRLYLTSAEKMRNHLSKSLVQYDMHAIVTGIITIWMIFIAYIFISTNTFIVETLCVKNIGYSVMIFSILASVQVVVCTGPNKSNTICPKSSFELVLVIVYVAGQSVIVSWCLSNFKWSIAQKFYSKLKRSNMSTVLLTVGNIVHALTLMSSSFVEEEHQTWYFYTTTVLIVIFMHKILKILLDSKYYRRNGLNNSDNSYLSQSNNVKEPKICVTDIWMFTVVLIISRILRSWNQTGDKWSHLPDIGDWLVKPENKKILSILVCVSLLLAYCVLVIKNSVSKLQGIMIGLALFLVYVYRANVGDLLSPVEHHISTGVIEANVVYGILVVMLLHSILKKQSSYNSLNTEKSGNVVDTMHITISVLGLLLCRPHNLIEFSIVILQEHLFSRVVSKLSLPSFSLIMVYLWMGNSAFFQQGNSNSLSTIDVSAGYVGMINYNPVTIGILLCIATYLGPLFWMISLLKHLFKHKTTKRNVNLIKEDILGYCVLILLFRCMVLSLYMINMTILRNHLFVWTVFSPKILYEGMHNLVSVIFVFLVSILTF